MNDQLITWVILTVFGVAGWIRADHLRSDIDELEDENARLSDELDDMADDREAALEERDERGYLRGWLHGHQSGRIARLGQ